MPTFLYAPEITVHIRTFAGDIYDVSEDISTANVRRSTGISSASMSLLNGGGKYDGVFSPMDQIVIRLRRIRPMVVFSGYLNQVPVFQTYAGTIQITASCTLKRLQYWYWDPTTTAAHQILDPRPGGPDETDAGIANRISDVLTKVVNWPKMQIHIAGLPADWLTEVKKVGKSVVSEAKANAAANMASAGMIAGNNLLLGGSSTKTPLAGQEKGTGTIPTPTGKVGIFGGAKSSRVGAMELTGEPRRRDDTKRSRWGGQYMIEMRWPYRSDSPGVVDDTSPRGSQSKVDVPKCQQWWAKQRLLVVNEKTGKGVVVRCADWGPSSSSERDFALSASALRSVGGKAGDTMRVVFAEENATLGPVSASTKGIDSGLAKAIANFGATAATAATGVSNVPPSSPGMKASGTKYDKNTVYSYLVKAGFSTSEAKTMTAIAVGESGLDLNILGDTTIQTGIWGPSVGLFQIRSLKADTGKGTTRDINALLNNPAKQAQSAYEVYKEAGGFRPWSVYTSGKYRQYLTDNLTQVANLPNGGGASGPSQAEQFTAMAETILKFKPRYVYGATPKSSEVQPAAFDCSSLVQWAAARIGVTTIPRTSGDQFKACTPISMDEAWRTRGALLSTTADGADHLAISRGDGTTIEARNSKRGTGTFSDKGTFVAAGLLNDIDYTGSTGAAGATGSSNNVNRDNFAQALFNAYDWMGDLTDYTGDLLGGIRTLMNDVPVFDTIDSLFGAGMREWCSAPNGDIIGWFPDYFGHYGTAAKMIVQDIEIITPFSVVWSDDRLKTHVFVSGSDSGMPGVGMDPMNMIRLQETAGIATIEQPELMQAILNLDKDDFKDGGKAFLNRFGARPEVYPMSSITGEWQEFFFAIHHFTKQWAQQYTAQIETTFMPEFFPGMIAVFPTWGVQAYIEDVNHDINLGPGGGFRTTTTFTAWSTIKGRKSPIKGLPKGGPL